MGIVLVQPLAIIPAQRGVFTPHRANLSVWAATAQQPLWVVFKMFAYFNFH